jgi:hypothetical protein
MLWTAAVSIFGTYPGGVLSSQVGIYRDTDEGECAVCMAQGEGWEERVVDQTVVYRSAFEIG